MRPFMRKKENENAAKEEEKERYVIIDEEERNEDIEMATEIRFEISAGRCDGYGDDDGRGCNERKPSKMSGVIRALTSESARFALGAVLDMFLAGRRDEDDER